MRASVGLLLLNSALACFGQTDVLTFHNDTLRTGQNTTETFLTTSNVKSTSFGKLFNLAVDGRVDAQPLIVTGLNIPNQGVHNVVFVVTEHDSVYAFDADTGTQYWHVNALKSGETSSDSRGCGQVSPEIGITGTPVIDRTAGTNGAIYLVAMSKDASSNYHQRLHALDLTTGAEQFSGPVDIAATYPGNGDGTNGSHMVVFDPKQYKNRPGLLLVNGIVYTSWSSHCDIRPYTGWTIGYNKLTLAQTGVFNFAPNGNEAAIWNAGGGPAADASGNLYFSVANGTFDTTLNAQNFPGNGDYGNAFVRLTPNSGTLTVGDYWTMFNTASESSVDEDLGSGGLILLPDVTDSQGHIRHLGTGAGKDANVYVFDRDNMGRYDSVNNTNIYQEIASGLRGGEFASPAWFNGTVYYGSVGDSIRGFAVTQARLSTTPTTTTTVFAYPGATPSISANGTSNGILWAVENSSPATLHAYDAANLATELYNSNQAAGSRDQFGAGNKYMVPTIANGKVYVGTPNSVAVFGLLPPTVTSITPTNASGSPQTFTAVFTDPAGYQNLNAVGMLINNSLSAVTGCYVVYSRPDSKFYLLNDSGTALVPGFLTPNGGGSLSNSHCSLSGTGNTVTGAGNTLTVVMPLSFTSAMVGTNSIWGDAVDLEGGNSGFQLKGTYTGMQEQAPGAIMPTNLTITGTSAQAVNVTFSDPNGYSDLQTTYVLINSSLSGQNGCMVAYIQSANQIYLINDAGTALVSGSITPGAGGSLSNSQCTVQSGGAIVATGSTLQLRLNITLLSGFGGTKTIYGYALDNEGQNSGWQMLGTFMRAANQPPVLANVMIASTPPELTATFTDPDGAKDIQYVYYLLNTSLNYANGCVILYFPSTNLMYLFNDAVTALVSGSITPGTAGALSNSQCTLQGSQSTSSVTGNNVSLGVNVTHLGTFPTHVSAYGIAFDSAGANTGWQSLGAVTLP